MKKINIQLKKTIALILFPVWKFFKKNQIWIVGASQGKKYTDNGVAFYRYVLENHPEIDIYWIINKDCPDAFKARKGGPFLYRNGIKGNIYTLIADVLVVTHTLPKDVSEYPIEKYKDSFKVFISHGIEGLKVKIKEHAKVHLNYNLSVAVSNFEKDIKVNQWGLEEDKICLTGLPRYDILDKYKNKKREKTSRIFYMPTWCPEYRKTFEKDYSDLSTKEIEDFKKGEYYQKIYGLLADKELIDYLEREDIELNCFFHQAINPFMEKVVNVSTSSQIKLLSNAADVQKELIGADILITDYSSVAWDFLYLNKPAIFYQFDQEKHLKTTGTYIEIPDDLFGPVTKTPAETIREIKRIETEDEWEEKREKLKEKFFLYDDNMNRKRIVDRIIESIN